MPIPFRWRAALTLCSQQLTCCKEALPLVEGGSSGVAFCLQCSCWNKLLNLLTINRTALIISCTNGLTVLNNSLWSVAAIKSKLQFSSSPPLHSEPLKRLISSESLQSLRPQKSHRACWRLTWMMGWDDQVLVTVIQTRSALLWVLEPGSGHPQKTHTECYMIGLWCEGWVWKTGRDKKKNKGLNKLFLTG